MARKKRSNRDTSETTMGTRTASRMSAPKPMFVKLAEFYSASDEGKLKEILNFATVMKFEPEGEDKDG